MLVLQNSKDEFRALRAINTLWLLSAVKFILNDAKIKWWLDYGTLLGATRDRNIIPWDGDCDLSCLEEDIPCIDALRGEFEKCGLTFYPGAFEKTGFQVFHPDKVFVTHMDIFTWYRDGDMLRRRFYIGMDSPTGTDVRKGRDFPAEWVENLSTVEILGSTFPAANNPAEFCKFRYGESWKRPMTVGVFNRSVPRRDDYGR